MSKGSIETIKTFSVGTTETEIEYKGEIRRSKDKVDNESITIEMVAQNGSKVAIIKGNAHYPLQFLLNVHKFCLSRQAKVRIKNAKMNFALDSWYHYLKDTDGEIKLSDFKTYEELLQSLWLDYVVHSSLDFESEVVYL